MQSYLIFSSTCVLSICNEESKHAKSILPLCLNQGFLSSCFYSGLAVSQPELSLLLPFYVFIFILFYFLYLYLRLLLIFSPLPPLSLRYSSDKVDSYWKSSFLIFVKSVALERLRREKCLCRSPAQLPAPSLSWVVLVRCCVNPPLPCISSPPL